jgi:hypothetical protein
MHNFFAYSIVIMFIGAAIFEAYNKRFITCQFYLGSAWLNILVIFMKG